MLLVHLIYTSGATQSQLDQQKQQAEQGRADMRTMRQQMLDLTNQQAALAAKVDMLLRANK